MSADKRPDAFRFHFLWACLAGLAAMERFFTSYLLSPGAESEMRFVTGVLMAHVTIIYFAIAITRNRAVLLATCWGRYFIAVALVVGYLLTGRLEWLAGIVDAVSATITLVLLRTTDDAVTRT